MHCYTEQQGNNANGSPEAKAVSWSSVNWLFLQKPVKIGEGGQLFWRKLASPNRCFELLTVPKGGPLQPPGTAIQIPGDLLYQLIGEVG